MLVSQVFVLYVLFSFVGWVWESTYCTIVERKWQNRGFLYGPVCPIYGTGVVAMMLVWSQVLDQGMTPRWWVVFLGAMLGSAVLEYATHWTLEKLFHAWWWDYSDMPLNLHGRICLPASVLFGLGGLLVVYVLYDPTVRAVGAMDPLLTEALSLVAMAALAADTALTASSLAHVSRMAAAINEDINAHMDDFVSDIQRKGAEAAQELALRREGRAAAAARERERFAEGLRNSQIGQMGVLVRSAVHRAVGAVSPDRLPDSPNREQLAKLWHDMLEDERR